VAIQENIIRKNSRPFGGTQNFLWGYEVQNGVDLKIVSLQFQELRRKTRQGNRGGEGKDRAGDRKGRSQIGVYKPKELRGKKGRGKKEYEKIP